MLAVVGFGLGLLKLSTHRCSHGCFDILDVVAVDGPVVAGVKEEVSYLCLPWVCGGSLMGA